MNFGVYANGTLVRIKGTDIVGTVVSTSGGGWHVISGHPKKLQTGKLEIFTKRSSPKRSSPKRSPKRSSPKRSSPKRSSPKRSSPKRSSPKRSSPKRSSPKRSSPKKSSPKKSSPKYVHMSGSFDIENSIKEVLKQVHPDHKISSEAKTFINTLVNHLFKMIIDDCKHKVVSHDGLIASIKNIIPGELYKHAISEFNRAHTIKLIVPYKVLDKYLKDNDVLISDKDISSLSGLLEYMIAEIIEVAGYNAYDDRKSKSKSKKEISINHVKKAINSDDELHTLFNSVGSPLKQSSPKKTSTKKIAAKYLNRAGPPLPANDYPDKIRLGNDRLVYESKANKNGVYKWVKTKKAYVSGSDDSENSENSDDEDSE